MPEINDLLRLDPFGMTQAEKDAWYVADQKTLTQYHYDHCAPYQRLVDRVFPASKAATCLADLPYVPANLFKSAELKSIPDDDPTTELTSSGTSGKASSKIFLDKGAALLQSRVLKVIFSSVIARDNHAMFVVDTAAVPGATGPMSASRAAVRGFAPFARKTVFLKDPEQKLDVSPLIAHIETTPEKPFFIFGFTSFVWTDLIRKLVEDGIKVPKNDGILIHGGGWKKMQDQSVSRAQFDATAKDVLGVRAVHNYYGMVEQTGSVFLGCEHGYFHASIFSDVIIRDKDLREAKIGEQGLIQVISLLPKSYPGHSILTEDLGTMEGVDDCACGRRGRYFSVHGRAPRTEIRGCSDAR